MNKASEVLSLLNELTPWDDDEEPKKEDPMVKLFKKPAAQIAAALYTKSTSLGQAMATINGFLKKSEKESEKEIPPPVKVELNKAKDLLRKKFGSKMKAKRVEPKKVEPKK